MTSRKSLERIMAVQDLLSRKQKAELAPSALATEKLRREIEARAFAQELAAERGPTISGMMALSPAGLRRRAADEEQNGQRHRTSITQRDRQQEILQRRVDGLARSEERDLQLRDLLELIQWTRHPQS